MNTITFTVGPPGAGKSRWAHTEVARRGLHEVQRINLDDFLTMVSGRAYGDLSGSDLKLAKRMLVNAARTIVESGRDLIVDNTHLSTRFPNLVRDELGDQYEYRIKDFTVVSVADCVEQDAVRTRLDPGGHVGEEVVRQMHAKGQSLQKRFGGPGLPRWEQELNRSDGIKPYVPDEDLPKAVIFDVDGTLALNTSRSPYDTSRYHTDEPETRLAQIAEDLRMTHEPYQIIVLTGRSEEFRDVLEAWFEAHGFVWDEIYMRPADQPSTRDNVVKLEMFDTHVRDRFNVIAAFDDRDRVVRLWRRLGLLALQANYGDF